METPLLEVKHLHKQFGSSVILRDLDLEVRKGEVVVIIGRLRQEHAAALPERAGEYPVRRDPSGWEAPPQRFGGYFRYAAEDRHGVPEL